MSRQEIKRAIKFRIAKAQWYKMVFESDQGQMVLADLIKFSNAHNQSYTPGDPTQTAFNEGMRRIVTRIEKFTGMTPRELKHIEELHRSAEDGISGEPYEGEYAA